MYLVDATIYNFLDIATDIKETEEYKFDTYIVIAEFSAKYGRMSIEDI